MSGAGTIAMARPLAREIEEQAAVAACASEIPLDTSASIVALAARTYPSGGNQLEAIARLAAALGWAAAVHGGQHRG